MIWMNYHTHTTFSDGKAAPSQYVLTALQENIAALGFSDHAPLPLQCDWVMASDQSTAYLEKITALQKEYSGQIQIYRGLEVDYIPGIMSVNHPNIQALGLDYTIGAIHFVDQFLDGTPWCIDGNNMVFKTGLKFLFEEDIRLAVHRYYQLIREMVTNACPTIVAHLDRIKIQNAENQYWQEEENWYRNEVIKTLECIAQSDAILELNMKTYYNHQHPTPNPSPWIINLAREMDIPMHLASDAHSPEDLIRSFGHGIQLLLQAGYKTVKILWEGSWIDVPIGESGIDQSFLNKHLFTV